MLGPHHVVAFLGVSLLQMEPAVVRKLKLLKLQLNHDARSYFNM
jgi:hypothetical protein